MGNDSGPNVTNDEELRMVMVGKTGIGKSATGNTILGRKCFDSKFSAKSMTVDCSKGRATVDGQQISVIDTPGLFDTRFDEERTQRDLNQCINYAAPGPHIFLVVIRLGRFTDEEKQTVQKIQEIFGQAADRYSMVLFTGGDLLEDTTIEEFLDTCLDLQELVGRCNGQYHVFNNKLKDEEARSQVSELLHKIRNIVAKNGGSHYTSEMFQEAERAIEEEKQRILEEKKEQIRKEKEEVERQLQEDFQKEMKKIRNQQAEAKKEEIEKMMKELEEEHERKMRAEKKRIEEQREKEARAKAEKSARQSGWCVIL